VGVGSITGVALAVSVGGAGSLFWMWVCSFFGFGLKYAEVALAHRHRVLTPNGHSGGAMYCLREKGYKKIAVLFAVLCVLSAVSGSSLVQAGAVSGALKDSFKTERICALFIAAAVAFVISGGRKWISAVNVFFLPALSAIFALFSVAVLIKYSHALPGVIRDIFSQAFGLKQTLGGVSGALMISVGCARGTFSNEAGMGSSALSYAAGVERDSHVQGLWGVTEVFIDSFVVSTLTGLCILCCGVSTAQGMFSASFGQLGTVFYTVAIAVFAFAAIISWCFYGEEALSFLFPKGKLPKVVFRMAVALFAYAGAVMPEGSAFAAADIWGGLMLFPNLFLLLISRSEIIELAKQNSYHRFKRAFNRPERSYGSGGEKKNSA